VVIIQPTLFNVPAFDATADFTFRFSYTGNQPIKNRLIIKDNVTEAVVYDQITTTMQMQHVLSADSITNRAALYNAQVQTFDSVTTWLTETPSVNTSTYVITSTGHGLLNGNFVEFSAGTGALPTGISSSVYYFVINKTTDTFQISTTSSGSAVEITSTGTAGWKIGKKTPSDFSSPVILFHCYATPTWAFSNVTNGQIINNSSISPVVTYSQTQSEPLNNYQILLYDSLHGSLTDSGTKYYISGDITHTFAGLSDNQQYYIRATGETLNHMLLDTGYVGFSVDYIQPVMYAILQLENIKQGGYVKVSNNIKVISGVSNPDPAEFSDGKVLLTDSGSYVIFDEAFSIQSDCTVQIDGNDFNDNSLIVEFGSNSGTVQLHYLTGTFTGIEGEKVYCKLRALSHGLVYTTISNLIDPPTTGDAMNIWIRRESNMFDVILTNMEVV
jgi:hypothetical protein